MEQNEEEGGGDSAFDNTHTSTRNNTSSLLLPDLVGLIEVSRPSKLLSGLEPRGDLCNKLRAWVLLLLLRSCGRSVVVALARSEGMPVGGDGKIERKRKMLT